MNKKVFLCLVVALCSCIVNVFAQQGAAQVKGAVSGRLIDAANNQPLPFATVALIKKSDNMPAKSIQTDMDGRFKLDNVADGLYLFRATYVGYTSFSKDSLLIGAKKRVYVFANIKLRETKGLLKEVTVKAQRSAIQLGVDKKVFSVDQSLVSQGGSATDLLSNVPSVQVDVDGNLNLRGSSNVRVLINGKPSALTGTSVADILQSIPASAIENIEVITNPSSKYDAEGQSGIINIVLKKNVRLGTNGSASFSAGNQKTYNGNINLAYQTKKINIYGNYSYRRANRVGNGYTNKSSIDSLNRSIYQNQIADQNYSFNGSNIRAGIDINLDPKTTLSFSGNANIRNRVRNQYGSTNIYTDGVLSQLTNQNTTAHGTGNRNLDYNADFEHRYKKQGEVLTANIGYSTDKEGSNDLQTIDYTTYTTPQSFSRHLQTNANNSDGHNLNLQLDFTKPLNHNNKLEAGYRSTFSESNTNNDVDSLLTAPDTYAVDHNLTNHFLYQEQVHAVYGNYQQQFGNFGIQAGVRLEDAHIRTLLRDSSIRHSQDYFRIYPSLFLSEKLNENETLQLSYTRRVSRPRDRQIIPFLDKSDPYNYQQGNPDLKPEDTHSFELSYIDYWKTLTLTSSIYYRLTNDNIERIRVPLTATVNEMTYANIANTQNAGFELIARVNATQNIDVTANVNAYYRYLQGDISRGLAPSSGYAWNANLTANLKPIKKLGIQLRGDYQAPQVITQGHQRAMAGLDAGLRYDITKKLNISGNVRDVFDSRKWGSIIDNTLGRYPYHSESVRRFQSRVMVFTLGYHFGSMPDNSRKDRKKDNNNNSDDMGNPDDAGNGGGGPKI